MMFELLLFAVIAITLFLSFIVINGFISPEHTEFVPYIGSVLLLWVLGNGLAFIVYLGVSALHGVLDVW